jgi:hypothetical protein
VKARLGIEERHPEGGVGELSCEGGGCNTEDAVVVTKRVDDETKTVTLPPNFALRIGKTSLSFGDDALCARERRFENRTALSRNRTSP